MKPINFRTQNKASQLWRHTERDSWDATWRHKAWGPSSLGSARCQGPLFFDGSAKHSRALVFLSGNLRSVFLVKLFCLLFFFAFFFFILFQLQFEFAKFSIVFFYRGKSLVCRFFYLFSSLKLSFRSFFYVFF